MSEILGRVTGDMEIERGPDALLRVEVPSGWLEVGARLRIEVPRRLVCAACQGGGCDRCGRAGGVTTAETEVAEPIELTLPPHEGGAELALRVPHRGGLARSEEQLAPGHLVVLVRAAERPSAGVVRVAMDSQESREAERRILMRRSALMALAVSAAFVAVLRLSGWI